MFRHFKKDKKSKGSSSRSQSAVGGSDAAETPRSSALFTVFVKKIRLCELSNNLYALFVTFNFYYYLQGTNSSRQRQEQLLGCLPVDAQTPARREEVT